MHPSEKIRGLEQLLARVSQRRAAPREPRLVLEQVTTPAAALVAPPPAVIAEAPEGPCFTPGSEIGPSRGPCSLLGVKSDLPMPLFHSWE